MKRTARSLLSRIVLYFILFMFVVLAFAPLYWMVTSSLKPKAEILQGTFVPHDVTTEHYREILSTMFPRWLFNSVVIAGLSVALGLFICSMAGYAFAKYSFPLKETLFWLVLGSISLPLLATIVPLFGWMITLGWIDTYRVMVLPMAANAFAVFLVRQYLKDLPDEYLEMARVLGADEFRIYFQIILPMMRPILATSAVFIALRSWNNYLWPLVMMRSERMYTFSVGLTTIQDPHEIKYGLLMAGATISVLPMLVFFLSLQKQYVSSISRGALK